MNNNNMFNWDTKISQRSTGYDVSSEDLYADYNDNNSKHTIDSIATRQIPSDVQSQQSQDSLIEHFDVSTKNYCDDIMLYKIKYNALKNSLIKSLKAKGELQPENIIKYIENNDIICDCPIKKKVIDLPIIAEKIKSTTKYAQVSHDKYWKISAVIRIATIFIFVFIMYNMAKN
jgi:hypothetical protein